MRVDEVRDSLNRCENLANYVPDNKFTKFDFSIRPDLVGRQIMEREYQICQGINEIMAILPKYKYLFCVADERYKQAVGKATTIVVKDIGDVRVSAKERNERIARQEVKLDGEEKYTTPMAEYMNRSMLEYLVSTGENKLSMGMKMLDLARSLLYFTKAEMGANV